jgi:hypothetical protein
MRLSQIHRSRFCAAAQKERSMGGFDLARYRHLLPPADMHGARLLTLMGVRTPDPDQDFGSKWRWFASVLQGARLAKRRDIECELFKWLGRQHGVTSGAVIVGLGGMWISTNQIGARIGDPTARRMDRVEDELRAFKDVVNGKLAAIDSDVARLMDRRG